ncbi:MAG: tungsten formylmethanofuran dehydrogenase [Mesorhizobium sp.]
MAVAWIDSRSVPVADAADKAAELLSASFYPVFSLDTDVHGTRAAIELARLVGAAYDQLDGAATAREAAQVTDKGGMFIAPGEVRRRADMLVIVGALPVALRDLIAELATTVPVLGGAGERHIFLIGAEAKAPEGVKAARLSCEGGLEAMLAALRARCNGRQTARPLRNFDAFAAALAGARFPVFTFCGQSVGTLGLAILQGLIADLNRKQRASALHLPASDNGWGSALASTWTTGFPLRSGFSDGAADFDPWRFDVTRMIADGEADLHLVVAADAKSVATAKLPLIALTGGAKPVAGAAVTIAIGRPGIDHDAVFYSARAGTIAAAKAQAPAEIPSAAAVLRMIAGRLPQSEVPPC